MKAIILAAGIGTRLSKYTNGVPKCLLNIGGKSILERQVETFRQMNVNDIVIVKGHAGNLINLPDVRYYLNKQYSSTNMVYSLFRASKELEGDVIISYADILFENRVLESLLKKKSNDIQVVVDICWKDYYEKRYDKPFEEAESLVMAGPQIVNIGQSKVNPSDIQGQYIGLIRLSRKGCRTFLQEGTFAREVYANKPWIRGRTFKQAYMTDFLQALIDKGNPVFASIIKHGWLEFDTPSDYELVISWLRKGIIDRFCLLE
jgi:L-glutamine-phosphate cytidylyltransferase